MTNFYERLLTMLSMSIAFGLILIQVNDEATGMLINERLGLAIAAFLLLGTLIIKITALLFTTHHP